MARSQRAIARQLGISPAAVCAVLADPSTNKVSAEKKARILELARDVELRRSKCSEVPFAVLLPKMGQQSGTNYLERMLGGARDGAENLSRRVILASDADDVVQICRARSVAGLILGDRLPEKHLIGIRARMPVVQLNEFGSKDCDSVVADERGGVCQAIHCLARLDHRRIAFYSSQADATEPGHLRERIAGYMEGIREQNLEFRPDYLVGPRLPGFPKQSKQQLKKLLHARYKPTAIIAFNDLAAAHVIREATAYGLSIPADLSVVGFDNSLLCELLNPRLTSIDADYEEMGRQAVECLRIQMTWGRKRSAVRIQCRTRILERKSVQQLTS